jgi:hypothetical protein
MNTTRLNNLLVFMANGIVTYYAAMFYLWSGNTKLIYWTWLVFVLLSNTLFTFLPKKFGPVFNFIIKVILHIVTTYLLMVIFDF